MLTPWTSFYLMIGSAAAALTGLMFVVISLVMGREIARNRDGIATFSTPTVLHFCAALLVSAILIVPWRFVFYPGILVALTGLYGLAHITGVMLRTKRLRSYRADLEDWAWYNVLPFLAYAAVFAGGVGLEFASAKPLAAIAVGVLLLLFIGIRNAWDVVTFIATGGPDSG
jgi:hypothetical protein